MKTILDGVGSFGLGWYHQLKTNYPHIQVAVVDRNPHLAARNIQPGDPSILNSLLLSSKNGLISS